MRRLRVELGRRSELIGGARLGFEVGLQALGRLCQRVKVPARLQQLSAHLHRGAFGVRTRGLARGELLDQLLRRPSELLNLRCPYQPLLVRF